MIEKLTLKNFQSHSFLELKLNPHVTTIVGPSDSGKSAILRALIWVATNYPTGDAFVRDGSKSTTVALKIDSHLIQRRRSTSVNAYELDGKELKAFGNNVPEEVARLLNTKEVNFQSQHDAPFWFSETAGEVSRQLNQIVDLSIIDRTLANLSKAQKDSQAKVGVLEGQLEEAKSTRSSLKWVREADKDLSAVENAQGLLVSATSLMQKLSKRVSAVEKYSHKIEGLRKGVMVAEIALKKEDIWIHADVRRQKMIRLIEALESSTAIIKRPVMDTTHLDKLSMTQTTVAERTHRLRDILHMVEGAKQEVLIKKTQAQETQLMFEKEMGDTCPLCGSQL